MTEHEKMLAGESFDGRAREIFALRKQGQLLLRQLNQLLPEDEARRAVCEKLFGQFGAESIIASPFCCEFGANISIGEHTYINFNVTILDVGPVLIGSNVLIAPNAQLYTATHDMAFMARRSWQVYGKAITIGDDVWVGGGAIICPGVTVGARSIIGAGAVVTRDVPEDVLVVGNPARIVRSLKAND